MDNEKPLPGSGWGSLLGLRIILWPRIIGRHPGGAKAEEIQPGVSLSRVEHHNPLETSSARGSIFCKEPEVLAGSARGEHLIKSVRAHRPSTLLSSRIHCNGSQSCHHRWTR